MTCVFTLYENAHWSASLIVSYNLFVMENNDMTTFRDRQFAEFKLLVRKQTNYISVCFLVTGFAPFMDICALFIAETCINSFSLCTS